MKSKCLRTSSLSLTFCKQVNLIYCKKNEMRLKTVKIIITMTYDNNVKQSDDELSITSNYQQMFLKRKFYHKQGFHQKNKQSKVLLA